MYTVVIQSARKISSRKRTVYPTLLTHEDRFFFSALPDGNLHHFANGGRQNVATVPSGSPQLRSEKEQRVSVLVPFMRLVIELD